MYRDVMLENYAHVASLGTTLSEPRRLLGDSRNSQEHLSKDLDPSLVRKLGQWASLITLVFYLDILLLQERVWLSYLRAGSLFGTLRSSLSSLSPGVENCCPPLWKGSPGEAEPASFLRELSLLRLRLRSLFLPETSHTVL